MFENKDDTILARWLEGTLTTKENLEFEQSPEYKEYQQIVNGLERFEKPFFDKEALQNNIKKEINTPKKGKVVNFKSFFYVVSVAASIALIFGIFFNEITYKTGVGEQLAFTLPNGSNIKLNAQSQLTHNRFFWKNSKKVTLQGEGFFSVKNGLGLAVETSSGTVTVLGTKFNIKTRDNLFELSCFEGKVSFQTAPTKEKVILTKGNSIKLIDQILEKNTIKNNTPSWINGKSSFNNVPLSDALNELQIQYGITIEKGNIDTSKRFSGSFFHDNLDVAIKTLLIPMSIEYELEDNKLKLISNKLI